METSEVLNRAADLIEQRGWENNKRGSMTLGWNVGDLPDAPLCLEGGIQAAMGVALTDFLAYDPALESCPAYLAVASYLDTQEELWSFNDSVAKSAAQVIEVLRACAVIEAAREEQDAAWETYAEVVTA